MFCKLFQIFHKMNTRYIYNQKKIKTLQLYYSKEEQDKYGVVGIELKLRR